MSDLDGLIKRLGGSFKQAMILYGDERRVLFSALTTLRNERDAAQSAAVEQTVALGNLLTSAEAARDAAIAERDEAREMYAREGRKALIEQERATAAKAERDEAVRGQQRLWDLARGWNPDEPDDGPRCRDCADNDGTCEHSGFPCDPQAEAEARLKAMIAARDAAIARAEKAEKALGESVHILSDAREKGLIYWAPQTPTGYVRKAEMLAGIDAFLSRLTETSDGK